MVWGGRRRRDKRKAAVVAAACPACPQPPVSAMATSSALPSGLVVTVTPLQSAFFAGELFSATVTLSNPAPVVATAPTLHSLHSLASLSLPRTAIPSSPSAWSKAQTPSSRQRPPSASHLGLAEYATNHLDSDEIPPSPFIGSGAGGINGRYGGSSPSVEALPTPNSADFEPSFRSLSGTHTPVASTSKAAVPTRKGLIGTALPVPSTFERRNSGSGIYRGGPRKPGGHGRAQSMAVSSPDLLVGTTDVQSQRRGSDGSIKGHGKSRLGGSLGGDGLAISFTEDKRRSSAQSRGKLHICASGATTNWNPLQYLPSLRRSPLRLQFKEKSTVQKYGSLQRDFYDRS